MLGVVVDCAPYETLTMPPAFQCRDARCLPRYTVTVDYADIVLPTRRDDKHCDV